MYLLVILVALVLIPIFFCYVFIARWINNLFSHSFKSDGSNAYIPITELYREYDHKKIIFYGCMHIGNQEYYQNLQSRLDNQDGLILFEGADRRGEPVDPKKPKVNPQANFNKLLQGFTLQRDGIKYRDQWQSNDLGINKMSQIMRLLNSDGFEDMIASYDEQEDSIKKLISWLLTSIIVNLYILYPVKWFAIKKSSRHRVISYWIEDKRNVHSMEILIDKLSQYDTIGLLWGAAHFNGMHKILQKEGFKITKTEWVTAMSNKQKLFPILKEMVKSKGSTLLQLMLRNFSKHFCYTKSRQNRNFQIYCPAVIRFASNPINPL